MSSSTGLLIEFLGVAQLGSAPPWGGGGRGFKSRRSDQRRIAADESRTVMVRDFFLVSRGRIVSLLRSVDRREPRPAIRVRGLFFFIN